MTTLVLTIPLGLGGYVVFSDASNLGLGCVLIPHEKLIAYASKQLEPYD